MYHIDVLNVKYGEDRIKKSHQVIVDACNQKCREIRAEKQNRPPRLRVQLLNTKY